MCALLHQEALTAVVAAVVVCTSQLGSSSLGHLYREEVFYMHPNAENRRMKNEESKKKDQSGGGRNMRKEQDARKERKNLQQPSFVIA